MSSPINLNKFRKQKARKDQKSRADENAYLFGLTKSEKELAKKRSTLEAKKLDSAKKSHEPEA